MKREKKGEERGTKTNLTKKQNEENKKKTGRQQKGRQKFKLKFIFFDRAFFIYIFSLIKNNIIK
jgi:hypothetical protein